MSEKSKPDNHGFQLLLTHTWFNLKLFRITHDTMLFKHILLKKFLTYISKEGN